MRANPGLRIGSASVLAASAVAGCIIHDRGAGAGGAVGGNLLPPSDLRPLRQAGAAVNRRIGTAMMSDQLAYGKLKTLVTREFDSLTPENEMKWEAVEPQPGVFSFAAADRL